MGQTYSTTMRSFVLRNFGSAQREFSSTLILSRKDVKTQLAKLGKSLLSGEVTSHSDSPSITEDPDPLPRSKTLTALEECSQKYKAELEESYSTLIQMSEDDIAIQNNFSRGLQWGGHSPSHFLDRGAAYRSIPDSIDLSKSSWDEIERVYGVLQDLDHDKALFERALKLANSKAPIPRSRNRQEKAFFESCRDLRRGVTSKIPLTIDQITKFVFPYNVVGFDKTFLGFPLKGIEAVSNNGEKLLPQELVEDFNSPFSTEITLKKEYVNIVDYDVMKNCIEPHYSRPKDLKKVLKSIGKPIFVEDISNYDNLGPPLLPLVEAIHDEIKLLCRSLESENTIKPVAEKKSDTDNESDVDILAMLTRANGFSMIKSGTHVLASKHQDATIQEGPTYKYLIKSFDIVPFCGMNFVTRKQYHLFYRHLFKVVLINCERQIDTLTRVKYKLPTEVDNFTRRLYGRIHRAIETKIIPVALKHRCVYSLRFDLILYKPMKDSPFLRLYWNKKPMNTGVFKVRPMRKHTQKYKILEIAHQ